jgi:hypothetical protein
MSVVALKNPDASFYDTDGLDSLSLQSNLFV